MLKEDFKQLLEEDKTLKNTVGHVGLICQAYKGPF
jgi:hypothetical protein